ncbi:MAG: hypothetical protein JNL66_04300 [Alphaproteobacteria bacterium]|nr:hypothetical protein [Alphaproteobacteria bacterium]
MADRSLIATTRQDGLRSLGIHGQPVAEAYGQIVRYLTRTLTPAHSALFAEPNFAVRPGVVEWYAAVEGEAVQHAAIAPETRPAFDAELARLVDDVAKQAALLEQSKESGDQLLGQLLALALKVPSDGHVYAVGLQPVLVAWGHLLDTPAADPAVLQKLIKAPPRPPAAPPVVIPPPPRRMWPWFLLLLLLILLLSLALPWLAAPLIAELARPDEGFCAIPEEQRRLVRTLDSEMGAEGQLRRELTFVEAQIAENAAACRAPAPPAIVQAPPTPAAPAVPPPTPPPVSPQPPATPRSDIPAERWQNREVALMQGCWNRITNMRVRRISGEEFPVRSWRMCFDENGNGTQDLVWENGTQCHGQVRARFLPDGRLELEEAEAPCSDGSRNLRAQTECTRAADGTADCDRYIPETRGTDRGRFRR